MDVSGENAQSQELFGILLVGVHVTMIITIVAQSCLAIQAKPENQEDLVDGLLTKVESKQSPLRRGSISDGSNGRKGEDPQVARIPERHSETKDGIIVPVMLEPEIRPRVERGGTGFDQASQLDPSPDGPYENRHSGSHSWRWPLRNQNKKNLVVLPYASANERD